MGSNFAAVSFAAENGAEITLYFDARTNLLARTEQLDSSAQLGDVSTGNIFSGYQQIGNVKIPRKRLTFINQYITGENEYAQVTLDFVDGEKLLEVPAGFVEPAPGRTAANAEVMRKDGRRCLSD
jgi:hypothetical protein